MKIAVHAGHNPDGMIACGAVGYIKESTVARQIVAALIPMLVSGGNEVWDATVNDGASQSDILKKIVNKSEGADLVLSIHLNSHITESAHGVEAWVHPNTTDANKSLARRIVYGIGDCTQLEVRAVPVRESSSLYILNHTSCPAILLECGFVTSLYDSEKIDPVEMAEAIAFKFGYEPNEVDFEDRLPELEEPNVGFSGELYRVQVGAFRKLNNAVRLRDEIIEKGYEAFITSV